MQQRGVIPGTGTLARTFAHAPRVVRRRPPVPPLAPGYLESLDACARANGCVWCQRALEAWRRLRRSTCRECGREVVRRFCREIGPCVTEGQLR